MGWFSSNPKKAEDDIDNDLKEYFKDATEGQQDAVPKKPLVGAIELPTSYTPPHAQQTRSKTLKQMAMDNCAEFEKAYSDCLLKGTIFERMSNCHERQTNYSKCQELQTSLLSVLGYSSAGSLAEKSQIANDADDFMLKYIPKLSISDEDTKNFNEALNQIKTA